MMELRKMQTHWTPESQTQCSNPDCSLCWAGADASAWPKGDTHYGATDPVTEADILAAAANLDGAERAWWCETHQQSVPPCGARMNCSTVGILVIPLPDKETPATTTSVTYPNIACHICGRLEGVHKLDCPA